MAYTHCCGNSHGSSMVVKESEKKGSWQLEEKAGSVELQVDSGKTIAKKQPQTRTMIHTGHVGMLQQLSTTCAMPFEDQMHCQVYCMIVRNYSTSNRLIRKCPFHLGFHQSNPNSQYFVIKKRLSIHSLGLQHRWSYNL